MFSHLPLPPPHLVNADRRLLYDRPWSKSQLSVVITGSAVTVGDDGVQSNGTTFPVLAGSDRPDSGDTFWNLG